MKLSWKGTGDDRDSYSVWSKEGGTTESGNLIAAGCGATRYLSRQAVTIANNDNTYSTTLENVSPDIVTLVTVVVEREGGYMASYQGISVNSVSKLSAGLFSFGLLLALLFV